MDKPNGIITSYNLYYTMDPGADLLSWSKHAVDDNMQFSFVISDLKTNQKYSIKMSASTKAGDSPVSAVVEAKTTAKRLVFAL